MNARLQYILKLVKNNPGVNVGVLQKLYDDGYAFSVDISTSVLKLLGSGELIRGDSRNGNNKGYYLPDSRELAYRKAGRCAWCGELSIQFYCQKHREARNERERSRRRLKTNFL